MHPFQLLRCGALFLVLSLSTLARAQQKDIPLQRDFYIDVERNAAAKDARIHTGLKPVLESRADVTNVMGYRVDSTRYYYVITEKIFKDHLLDVKGDDFRLTGDVLFNFEYGDDFGDRTIYADTNSYFHNARGFWFTGDLGKRISFQTMFHEHQTLVPQYLFTESIFIGTVSGQGRTKLDKKRILDYAWSQGSISYTPKDWLNIKFGQGRHFVGHGYRSMLLSDHAIGVPFLEFSLISTNRRFQYTTWTSKLQSGVYPTDRLPTGQSSESLFYWMRGRFNHLSVDLGRVQLGLFECTLFENIDSSGVRPFDALELNPVIGVNTAVKGFDGREKSLVGLDMRVKLTNKGYVYGQFATDGPSKDKFAYQVGLRWFDVIKKDLHIQLEYNAAKPFMYTNNPTKLAYKQAGLPLAHPFGAYFEELVVIVDAGFGRLIGQAKLVLGNVRQGESNDYIYGNRIAQPDRYVPGPDGPYVRQLFYYDLNASYLLNPSTNLRVVAGVQRRSMDDVDDALQSTYVYLGIRTSLFNRYYDI